MIDFNPQRLWHAVKERWLFSFILCVGIGLIFTYKTLKKQYVYQATCKMEFSSSVPEISLDNRTLWRYSSYILQNLYLTSQRIIMTSDPVIDKVVRSLKLVEPNAASARLVSARNSVVSALSIEKVPESQIFMIRAKHANPQMAQDIANAVSEIYIRHSYENKIENYKTSIQWLDEELVDLKSKLEKSQQDLMDFVEREGMTGNVGDEKTTDKSYTQGKTVFDEMESLIQSLRTRRIEEEMSLQRVKEKYLPAHPEYQRLEREIQLLDTKIGEQEERLASLRAGKNKEIISSRKKEIEYSILKREVEINKEIYNALIRKYKETDIGSAIAQTEANVIERANLPTSPIYPNKRLLITLSWLIGLFVGLGFAIVAAYIDTSIKGPEDIEEYFSIPLLSVVGKYEKPEKGLIVLIDDDDPNKGEAMRILRTNLNFSLPKKQESRLIMVGSTRKGEGKSTVAVNLGMVTAELKKKTLLIDGDLRARSLTKHFGFQEALGLTSYLVGECTLEQCLHENVRKNLDVIPAGQIPPKPSTLLDSETMSALLLGLRGEYDEIIIDAPPVNVVIDATIIASMVDGVVLVVEASTVSRHDVQRAVNQLDKAKATIFGLVLNKFDVRSTSYYGYGSYYYYGGYCEEEQPKQIISKTTEAPISKNQAG